MIAARLVIAWTTIVIAVSAAGAHDPAPTGQPPSDAHDDHAAPPARGPHEHHSTGNAATVHVHPPVPAAYSGAHVPAAAWTDRRLIERGKTIYEARCAVCHGDSGDGKGPAVAALPLVPPSMRDARMVNEMAGNYWFWRVSEGGLVEPFRSAGSVMPAWKHELSVEDRWAVIAFQHTFSGHDGPHVTSEHPELVTPSHRRDAPAPAASGGTHRH